MSVFFHAPSWDGKTESAIEFFHLIPALHFSWIGVMLLLFLFPFPAYRSLPLIKDNMILFFSALGALAFWVLLMFAPFTTTVLHAGSYGTYLIFVLIGASLVAFLSERISIWISLLSLVWFFYVWGGPPIVITPKYSTETFYMPSVLLLVLPIALIGYRFYRTRKQISNF